MKPTVHYLRSNAEITFEQDSKTKLYRIQSGTLIYQMPYVLTLRLKRYLKETISPTPQQLGDWYESLPVQAREIVQRSIIAR